MNVNSNVLHRTLDAEDFYEDVYYCEHLLHWTFARTFAILDITVDICYSRHLLTHLLLWTFATAFSTVDVFDSGQVTTLDSCCCFTMDRCFTTDSYYIG